MENNSVMKQTYLDIDKQNIEENHFAFPVALTSALIITMDDLCAYYAVLQIHAVSHNHRNRSNAKNSKEAQTGQIYLQQYKKKEREK